MECDKEDALKAKQMAEKKFEERDIAGAKGFALMAQKLYPNTAGLPQLIATLDVYISAEEMPNGERDWYRVLGVDPTDDEHAIRTQFKRLAKIIHPDRNKSVGADGAFKIVSAAWNLLSKSGKRKAYDQVRKRTCKFENIFGKRSSVPDGQNGVPDLSNWYASNESDFGGADLNMGVPNLSNNNDSNERVHKRKGRIGVLNLSNDNVSNERDRKGKGKIGVPNLSDDNTATERDHRGANYFQPPSDSSSPIKPTFWTACNSCNVHFEYHRKYLRCNLLCSYCRRPFHALEVLPPPNDRNRFAAEPVASPLQKHNADESTINNSSSAGETRPTSSISIIGQARFSGFDSSQKTSQASLFSVARKKGKGRTKKEVSIESMREPTSATSRGQARFSGLNLSQKTSQAGLFSDMKKKEVSAESMMTPTYTTGAERARFSGLNSSLQTFQASLFLEAKDNEEVVRNQVPTENMRAPTCTTSVGLARYSGLCSSQSTFQAGLFSRKDVSAENMRAPASVSDRRNFKQRELALPEVTKTSSQVLKNVDSRVALGSSVAGFGTLPKEDMPQKRGRPVDQMATLVGTGNLGVAVKTVFGSQEGGTAATSRNMAGSGTGKVFFAKELPQKEVPKMLTDKAKKEIREKLAEWRTAAAPKIPYKSKETINNEKGKKEAAKPGVKESTGKIAAQKVALKLTPNIPDPVTMTVVDPDFYDFDKNRTESSFAGNQVWAAYDQEDGMPRYYALIHNVMSDEPFKISISWLNAKSTDEFGPLSWLVSGFPKTSGEFRVGRHEFYGSLNSFSHQVKWTRVARGVVQIYPRKGDVWALYRNWSPDWNERTPDEVVRKYDMVEVIEDYNEERGTVVFPLVKVVGYKTVFCRHWDMAKVTVISREEMFRFSHQVPSHMLTGDEGLNAPPNCLELDPAAIPSELLQVTNDAPKEDKVKRTANSMEMDPIESSKRPKIQEPMESCNLSTEKGPVQDAEKIVAGENGKKNGKKLAVYSRRGIGKVKKI